MTTAARGAICPAGISPTRGTPQPSRPAARGRAALSSAPPDVGYCPPSPAASCAAPAPTAASPCGTAPLAALAPPARAARLRAGRPGPLRPGGTRSMPFSIGVDLCWHAPIVTARPGVAQRRAAHASTRGRRMETRPGAVRASGPDRCSRRPRSACQTREARANPTGLGLLPPKAARGLVDRRGVACHRAGPGQKYNPSTARMTGRVTGARCRPPRSVVSPSCREAVSSR